MTGEWIGAALAGARPQAVGALLRKFGDLDRAEEAYQEACLRALRTWPVNGPPRDPSAWLIMVGKNASLDALRRTGRETALPDEEALSDLSDVETPLAEALDGADYRDDVLRLLFTCCHPELADAHQIALALRIVCGLSVKQIARAFLVGEAAMEQRITRAKARIAQAGLPYAAPGAVERAERLAAVAAVVYLMFNDGYSAAAGETDLKGPMCGEAVRLGRLLLRLFPAEPEIMGLLALMLLQGSRAAARFTPDGAVVPLDAQDRARWDRRAIAEGLALIDKALRHRRPGPYQVQAALAALHARAPSYEDTDWAQMAALYGALEAMQPSPVVTLNRAATVAKVEGAAAALALVEPLAERLDAYAPFHAARGSFLLELDRPSEARHAFDRAVALARSVSDADHIRRHLDGLMLADQARRGRAAGRGEPQQNSQPSLGS